MPIRPVITITHEPTGKDFEFTCTSGDFDDEKEAWKLIDLLRRQVSKRRFTVTMENT